MVTDKFQKIIDWQIANQPEVRINLNVPAQPKDIHRISQLLDEAVPSDFTKLYEVYDGEHQSTGVLFSHHFMSANEIIKQLEFSRGLVKSENPHLKYPEKSNLLVSDIITFYKDNISNLVKTHWYKIEFACGPGSFEGPYNYPLETSTNKERSGVRIPDYKPLQPIIKELHDLERDTYNWDKLKFVLYKGGEFEIERTLYDFDTSIESSTPENAIRKKYFHYKWLPIFSDSGGNYIGIDLDPDVNGTKGQVIVYGRDERDMIVAATDLSKFFDLVLGNADSIGHKMFVQESHLHEMLKDMLKNKP